jgi:hypothetical protein
MRGRGRVHGGERGRFGGDGSDRRGPRNKERASELAAELTSGARGTTREGTRAWRRLALTSRPLRAARGREGSVRARAGADMRGPPVRGWWALARGI